MQMGIGRHLGQDSLNIMTLFRRGKKSGQDATFKIPIWKNGKLSKDMTTAQRTEREHNEAKAIEEQLNLIHVYIDKWTFYVSETLCYYGNSK